MLAHTNTALSTVTGDGAAPGAKPNLAIPDHQLVRRIGQGAYGEVWLARNVLGAYRAVKVVYRVCFRDERVYEREFRGIQRFEPISRSNDGLLDILQAGRNDEAGYYYYVMELADDAAEATGVGSVAQTAPADPGAWDPARSRIDPAAYVPKTLSGILQERGRLPAAECIQVGLNLTMALSHLHRHGLIHRDIKPANIIFVQGVPKLADIGLVTTFDDTCSFVGTEGFIAPEGPTSPRADLYSLGKVLYEMSTGRDRKDFPEPPTALGETAADAELSELNAVVLRACALEVKDRYQTAEEFHADLALLQTGRSVKNRRRLEKRVVFLTKLAGVIAGGAAVALAAYAFQRHQTSVARRLAYENRRLANEEARQRTRAQENLQHFQFQQAHQQFQTGDASTALAYLAKVLRREPGNRIAAERLLSALTHRQYALPRFGLGHSSKVLTARFSRNGALIVTTAEDGKARVWRASSGTVVAEFTCDGGLVDAQFSPDSRWVLTRASDGTVQIRAAQSSGRAEQTIDHPGATLAEFSPDSERVITASSDGTVRIWERGTGLAASVPLEHEEAVTFFRYDPSTRNLVTRAGGTVRVWNVAAGKVLRTLNGLPFGGVDVSPDGRRLIWLRSGLAAQVCDLGTGEPVSAEMPHKFPISDVKFSPDGRRVVTASNDQTARIWDAETGEPLGPPLAHGNGVLTAAFSANGERLLTVARDGYIRLWNGHTGELVMEPVFTGGEWASGLPSAELSFDERWILVRQAEGKVSLWDARYGPALPLTIQPENDRERLHADLLGAARFDASGKKVLTVNGQVVASALWVRIAASGPTSARVWDAENGRPISPRILQSGDTEDDRAFARFSFSPDGRFVAAAAGDGTVAIWDALTGEPRIGALKHPLGVSAVAFSPSSPVLATACLDSAVRLWDINDGKLLGVLQAEVRAASRAFATFSPDGKWLASVLEHEKGEVIESSARIWNAATGDELAVLAHPGIVSFAAFSPDSARVVTAERVGSVARIWEARTGKPVTDWLRHDGGITYAEFSPDGRQVVTCSEDRTARIWDAQTGRLLAGPLKHAWDVLTARFNRDGLRLVTASWDQTAQLWDVATGLPISEPLRHKDWVHGAEFSPDGRRVLTTMVRQSAQIWDLAPPPLPVPEWLLGLAEVLAQQQFGVDDNLRRIEPEAAIRFVSELRSRRAEAPLAQWLAWFLADRESRTISASSQVTVREHLAQRIRDDSSESLVQAARLAPVNPMVLARFGRKLLVAFPRSVMQQRRAEWLTRFALGLAPSDASLWAARADVLARLERWDEAEAALAKALGAQPDDIHARTMRALIWQHQGRGEEAYRCFKEALRSIRSAAPSAEPAGYMHEGLREIRELPNLDLATCAQLAERKRLFREDDTEANWLTRLAGESAGAQSSASK